MRRRALPHRDAVFELRAGFEGQLTGFVEPIDLGRGVLAGSWILSQGFVQTGVQLGEFRSPGQIIL